MSTRYGNRDYDRGRREYGRRSDSDYDRSQGERSQGRYRYRYDRDDDDDRERYAGESRWRGQSGRSQHGSEYGRSRYGRQGYRPGSENDWDYADDRESRYGSFMRGYDTGSYDDTSSSGYPQRDYDYGRGRYGDDRSWLDRLADKLAAWFGDEEAERRSRMGEVRERQYGRGPKSYRRSDERIREDVNDRLSEGYLDATDIEVLVTEGLVTLTGTVNSRTDKRRAEDIADDVRGVKNVENRLRVQQSDIDRYPNLHGTTGTTGASSIESTGAARSRTAGQS